MGGGGGPSNQKNPKYVTAAPTSEIPNRIITLT